MTNEQAIDELMNFYRVALECTDEKAENALRIAIESIEKQIPKKPLDVYIIREYGCVETYTCPSCSYKHKKGSAATCGYDYCTECGQRIDWSE